MVLVGVVWMLSNDHLPTTGDWVRTATLATASLAHHIAVRRAEEERRDSARGPHMDLTSVWTFAAVLVLPSVCTVTLIMLIRMLIQPIARRKLYQLVFSTAEILASVLAVRVLIKLTGVAVHPSATGLDDLVMVVVLAVAAVIYGGIQAVAVGGAIKLTQPGTRWRQVLGSREDNLLEVTTLGAGALLGVLMTGHWAAALLAVVPVSMANIMLDRTRQRHAYLHRLLGEQQQLLDEQQQRHQQLTEDAHTDYRTGLLNSNGLAEYGERLAQRCLQDGQEVTVLVIDLDHFKSINDTWGHPAGNAVLAEVGRVLREKLRPDDLAARDGGEEFVVVLADTSTSEGVVVAERIRSAIATLTVITKDKRHNLISLRGRSSADPLGGRSGPKAISASIGLATIPNCGTSLGMAQHSADTAVYEAKERGRNQVWVARQDGGGLRMCPADAFSEAEQDGGDDRRGPGPGGPTGRSGSGSSDAALAS
ncbi:GGDEF domain-containing protein [Goodfellowiella coeruleoviolacea]|uniref:GGDEF domain-containing protein n=1 Tax=Goodfellowiella coeruleoviolacea TaxID=334858 RepID=UPI0020A285D7|nr:GGDEF domain-containing protein [Goodfellowiella coeruleoviolacea]